MHPKKTPTPLPPAQIRACRKMTHALAEACDALALAYETRRAASRADGIREKGEPFTGERDTKRAGFARDLANLARRHATALDHLREIEPENLGGKAGTGD